MIKLSFDSMTLDLNIFNLQRQLEGFDNVDHSILNWVGNFSHDELEFEHVDEFPIECKSFFMGDEPEDDIFDFDYACSVEFIAHIAYVYDTSAIPLDPKFHLTLSEVLF